MLTLAILALYGFHRGPARLSLLETPPARTSPRGAFRRAADRHRAAPDVQRALRRRAPHRERRVARVPQGQARDSGARRLDRRDGRDRPRQGRGARRARLRRGLHPSHRPDRLQGRRARGGSSRRQGRLAVGVRRRLRAHRVDHRGPRPSLPRRRGRDGPGALGSPQPQLLDADPRAVDDARRSLHHRAHRAQPLGPLLQLQRYRGDVAQADHHRRRRLATRHVDRGHGPELSRAARGLAFRLCPRRARAGRDPGAR